MRIAPILALLAFSGMLGAAVAQSDDLTAAGTALRVGDLAAAAAAIDRYLATKPADERGRFMKGVILSEQGRTSEAFDVFFALTVDHPELAEPYNNIAVIYASRGEYERARDALESAIRANPEYAVAYENLGDVYARLAARAYQRSLDLDIGNRTVRAKLALARELPEATPKRSATSPPASPASPASPPR
ncbi:MAG TPA: tetratricopeptide repeat protein [Burkholderiales bacterium]|nr:tetratricopeptide repeat protein [Burkholderiales bacterium]